MTTKLTFFGAYGTGHGRSEDLPKIYTHELEQLKKYANKITSFEELGKREFLDAARRQLMFNYIEAFKVLYLRVYGIHLTTNLFEMVKIFNQCKLDVSEANANHLVGGLS